MGIKKITFLFFITLTSCFSNEKDDVQKEYQYNDFPSSIIEYENVFDQEEVNYLVYIYSLNCRHCQQIKNDVLSFVESGSVKT